MTLRWMFLGVQTFMLIFLVFHDWIHLPPWTDARAARRVYPFSVNLRNTLINTVPVALAFALTIRYLHTDIPVWVRTLWILLYGLFLLGEYRTWWHPYWFGWEPERLARYQALFGGTRTFLPRRGGMAPMTPYIQIRTTTIGL